MHALGLEFGSAAQLPKRPGSVGNCLWGNALKRSPGIIRKSRVSYPGPGFLSSATWPSLPKKHYNGLNQTKSIKISSVTFQALVDVSDKNIYSQLICGNEKNAFFKGCMANMLRQVQSAELSSRLDILRYMGERFRVKLQLPAWYTDAQVGEYLIE